MMHGCELDAKLFAALGEIDDLYAWRVKAAGCADCGGPLDGADYERKPRGVLGEAADAYTRRRSFCCRKCRHRATPPSVRFLGRKVYVGVLIVVASVVGRATALIGRARPRLVEGVPVRTVRRWLDWWSVAFAMSELWIEARGLFATPVDVAELPGSLLERVGKPNAGTLTRLLALIAPITTTSVKARIVMPV